MSESIFFIYSKLKKSSSLFIEFFYYSFFSLFAKQTEKYLFFFSCFAFFILKRINRLFILFLFYLCKLRKNIIFNFFIYIKKTSWGFNPNPLFYCEIKNFHYYAMKKVVRLAPKTLLVLKFIFFKILKFYPEVLIMIIIIYKIIYFIASAIISGIIYDYSTPILNNIKSFLINIFNKFNSK